MPTTYAGDANNVTIGQLRNITGADDSGVSGEIRITTSGVHLFGDADWVKVEGVTGTTEANGEWEIAVMTSTTFRLLGSTFANAYVSGGAAKDLTCIPQASIASDGEAATAAALAAPVQVALDRTQALALLASRLNVIDATIMTVTADYVLEWPNGRGSSALVFARCVGGGGGGGGGPNAGSSYDISGGGGGGGCDEWGCEIWYSNDTLTIGVGAGGAGGAGGATPADGAAGDASYAKLTTAIAPFVVAYGGRGGGKGIAGAAMYDKVLAPGGPSYAASSDAPQITSLNFGVYAAPGAAAPASWGGNGKCFDHPARAGGAFTGLFDGGGSGQYRGGESKTTGEVTPVSNGGGGGATRLGIGGDSGAATDPAAPTVNTGAGGAGGGANLPGPYTMDGAAGASGKVELFIVWLKG